VLRFDEPVVDRDRAVFEEATERLVVVDEVADRGAER
jgi:hypothetical protein